jgi:hypothetical protein
MSNKCEIARGAREKGKKTGNSRDQRNLDRIEGREDGRVEPDEIEPYGNTPSEEEDSGPDERCNPGEGTDSEAESEASSNSRPSIELELENNRAIARGERVRRHIGHWMRKNLVNSHFSKRKETEVEEMRKTEEIRYRKEIEGEYKGKDPVLQEIKREERREEEERWREKEEEKEEENRKTERKLREKFTELSGDKLLE